MKKVLSILLSALFVVSMFVSVTVAHASMPTTPPFRLSAVRVGDDIMLHVIATEYIYQLEYIEFSNHPADPPILCSDPDAFDFETDGSFTAMVPGVLGELQTGTNPIAMYNGSGDPVDIEPDDIVFSFRIGINLNKFVQGTDYTFSVQFDVQEMGYLAMYPDSIQTVYNEAYTGNPLMLEVVENGSDLTLNLVVASATVNFGGVEFYGYPTCDQPGAVCNTVESPNLTATNGPTPSVISGVSKNLTAGQIVASFPFTVAGGVNVGTVYTFTLELKDAFPVVDPTNPVSYPWANDFMTVSFVSGLNAPDFQVVEVKKRMHAGTTEYDALRFIFTLNFNDSAMTYNSADYGSTAATKYTIAAMRAVVTRVDNGKTISIDCPKVLSANATTFQFALVIYNLGGNRKDWTFSAKGEVDYELNGNPAGTVVSLTTGNVTINTLADAD